MSALVVGDIVLRRMRGQPWWPSIIVAPKSSPDAVRALFEESTFGVNTSVVRFYPLQARAEYDVVNSSELLLLDSDEGRAKLNADMRKLTGVKLKKLREAVAAAEVDVAVPRSSREIAFGDSDDEECAGSDESSLSMAAASSSAAAKIADTAKEKDEMLDEPGEKGPAAKRQRVEEAPASSVGTDAGQEVKGSASVAESDALPVVPKVAPSDLSTSSDPRTIALSLKDKLIARVAVADTDGILALLKNDACMNLRVTVDLLSDTRLLDVIKPLQQSSSSAVREAAVDVVQLYKSSCKNSIAKPPAVVTSAPAAPRTSQDVSPLAAAAQASTASTTPSNSTPRIAEDLRRLQQPKTPQRALAIAMLREVLCGFAALGSCEAATTSVDRVALRISLLLEQSILEHVKLCEAASAQGSSFDAIIARIEDDTQQSAERSLYRRLLSKYALALHSGERSASQTTERESRLCENMPKLRKILANLATKPCEASEKEAFLASAALVR